MSKDLQSKTIFEEVLHQLYLLVSHYTDNPIYVFPLVLTLSVLMNKYYKPSNSPLLSLLLLPLHLLLHLLLLPLLPALQTVLTTHQSLCVCGAQVAL